MNYSQNYFDYIEYVKSLNRKRTKKFLQNGLENPAYIYYEKHHVLPRSCGGSNNKDNLVLLTAREHYLAHYLLMKIYKDTKFFTAMQYAFFMMSSKLGKKSMKEKCMMAILLGWLIVHHQFLSKEMTELCFSLFQKQEKNLFL